jgi:hypothetical protein
MCKIFFWDTEKVKKRAREYKGVEGRKKERKQKL